MFLYRRINNDLYIGRLQLGDDLIKELRKFCEKENIKNGWLQGIGAVKKVSIGFYHQERKTYILRKIEKPMEITNFTGNISIKESKIFIHAHITLCDEEGYIYGGHVVEDTIVFAAEVIVKKFSGECLFRTYHSSTGLYLWEI